jgi:excinuclease ABC subunit A
LCEGAQLRRRRCHLSEPVSDQGLAQAIKTADWIIDLGPEGGDGGGEIVAAGPPEEIVKEKRSYTGAFLKGVLGRRENKRRKGPQAAE